MTGQLPVLQVAAPLLCAPLCVLLRSRLVAWLLFLAAALASLTCAVWLAERVEETGALRYAMGDWQAPYGIEFVVNGFNTPVLLLVSLTAVVVAVYGRRSVAAELDARRATLLYACLCLALAGLLGLAITGDVFNAFVFLEISSLSTYTMIAMGRRRQALLAGFRYLVIGTIGATFMLIGIGLAYAVTGTLNMADLAQRLTGGHDNRALQAAVVFVFVGLAVKMAVFPLHAWLPAAYAEAPSVVSTFVAATGTKVAVYVFCRFAFTVFGASLVFGSMPVDRIGLLLACLGILAGSAAACFQDDLRYVLAWSSVAQVGYIVAGVSLATAVGVSAAYLHMIMHAVTKAALFAIAGLLLLRLGSVRLSALAGIGRRMPWTFAAFVVAGLGLVGVPPTAGFVSKWALVTALVERDQWPVAVAMLAGSLLALVYVGRVVEVAWFREPPDGAEPPRPPASMVAAIWFLVLLSVYFGIDASLPAHLADAAAEALLGNGGG
ncbi:monovalent cation/H+ antiporter subunit D family protein [Streptomyces sp. DG2A-72]|uniref:monovalent cation/H+ antiporter subunit D family protein n=1 Tax=Streptomyces sp. DG2A-72 TaxID=3051386 RepID=UPI00265BBA14|nr:monovalent cation/H+ antiporter subunit D family protein [Streptomyces sp. DG2A-72]MDO0938438.1 monovalent cation/H+ antiporter subunit D family protein [Streptomyces sp. DG2A-72]